MPELPQMQALAERLDEWLGGAMFAGFVPLGFSGLKTVVPAPDALIGLALVSVDRRGKNLSFVTRHRAGVSECLSTCRRPGGSIPRTPPKKTKPKGAVVRCRFDDESDDRAVLLREYGTNARSWWVLAPTMARCDARSRGRLATSSNMVAHRYRRPSNAHHPARSAHRRRNGARLRRRRVAPGEPLAVTASPKLTPEERDRLLDAIRTTMTEALDRGAPARRRAVGAQAR